MKSKSLQYCGLACSMVFTAIVAVNTPKNWLPLALGVGGSVGLGSYLLVDTKLNRKLQETEKQVRDAREKTSKAERTLGNVQTDLINTQSLLEASKGQFVNAQTEYEKLQAQCQGLKSQYFTALSTTEKLRQNLALFQSASANKDESIQKLETRVSELETSLQEVIEEWEETTDEKATVKAKVISEGEIKHLHESWNARIDELCEMFDEMSSLFRTVGERNQQLKGGAELTLETHFEALENWQKTRADLESTWDEQQTALTLEIDDLRQLANGEITKPVYMGIGYSRMIKPIDEIIRVAYEDMGIPLEFTGGKVSDDDWLYAGLRCSKSSDVLAIVNTLNRAIPRFIKATGMHVIEPFTHEVVGNYIAVRFRDRPVQRKRTEDEFYRIYQVKRSSTIDELVKNVLLTKNVPSLRVCGESGSGKSSLVRLMVSELNRQQPHLVRLHDPRDGSSEDRWEIDKASKGIKETAKSMSSFADSVNDGLEPKVPTIDIFDELDSTIRQHKETLSHYKSVSVQVRHLEKQKLIVLGQNPKVKGVGLEWSDMDSMACIYVGDSAIHAIKNSPKLAEKQGDLTAQYSAISEYYESKNEELKLDSDNPNHYRFCLVCIPRRKPFWFELPSFTDGINGCLTMSQLEEHTEVASNTPSNQPATAIFENLDIKGFSESVASNTKPLCSHCGANNLKLNGKTGQGKQRYSCKVCSKSFTQV